MDETVTEATDSPVKKRRKVFACPHCGEWCVLPVEIRILEPEKCETDPAASTDPLSGLTPDQRQIVERAEKTGLLAAFQSAIAARQGVGDQGVRNPGKYLISFLRLAAPKRVPSFVLKHYSQQFPGRLEFWGSNGILGVTADGKLSAFLPQRLAVGTRINDANGARLDARLPVVESDFYDWVKTRHGYVPTSCPLFLKELQKRSVGEFVSVSMGA